MAVTNSTTLSDMSNLRLREMLRVWTWRHPHTGCLIWMGSCVAGEYGKLQFTEGGEIVSRLAHRAAWYLDRGPILDGLFVCHRCDNRRCCNVEHLFLGTATDNMRDMVEKGRSTRGIRQRLAKLTEDEVRAIRVDSRTCKDIGLEYNMTAANISRVRSGKIWRHVQ